MVFLDPVFMGNECSACSRHKLDISWYPCWVVSGATLAHIFILARTHQDPAPVEGHVGLTHVGVVY